MMIEPYVNSGSIRSLLPVLEQWIQITEKYMIYSKRTDNPWWYNERASVSMLSAAVWACKGCIALEEYSALKKGRGSKGKKKNGGYNGRCDLYIGLENQSFVCEAKQVWPSIGTQATMGIGKVKQALDKACEDARRTDMDEKDGRRLGLCFATPYLPKSDKDVVKEHLSKWLNGLENIDCDAFACTFPKVFEDPEFGEFFPGCALLIKEVEKSKR